MAGLDPSSLSVTVPEKDSIQSTASSEGRQGWGVGSHALFNYLQISTAKMILLSKRRVTNDFSVCAQQSVPRIMIRATPHPLRPSKDRLGFSLGDTEKKIDVISVGQTNGPA